MADLNSTEIPANCPYCGRHHDLHSSRENIKPTPGDISLCIGCSEIAVFTDDLQLRKPTEAEVDIIDADEDLQHELSKLRAVIAMGRAMQSGT